MCRTDDFQSGHTENTILFFTILCRRQSRFFSRKGDLQVSEKASLRNNASRHKNFKGSFSNLNFATEDSCFRIRELSQA